MRGILLTCLVVLVFGGGFIVYDMNNELVVTNPPKTIAPSTGLTPVEVPSRLPLLGESEDTGAGPVELESPDQPVASVETADTQDLTVATPYSLVYVQDMLGREVDPIVAAQAPPGTHEPLAMWRDRDGHIFMLYLNEAKASQASTLLRSYGMDDDAVANIKNLLVWSYTPLEANFMSSLEAKLATS